MTIATKVLDTVHETAKGLHESGAMSMKTLREFDALHVVEVKNGPQANLRKSRRKLPQKVPAAKNRSDRLCCCAALPPGFSPEDHVLRCCIEIAARVDGARSTTDNQHIQ